MRVYSFGSGDLLRIPDRALRIPLIPAWERGCASETTPGHPTEGSHQPLGGFPWEAPALPPGLARGGRRWGEELLSQHGAVFSPAAGRRRLPQTLFNLRKERVTSNGADSSREGF